MLSLHTQERDVKIFPKRQREIHQLSRCWEEYIWLRTFFFRIFEYNFSFFFWKDACMHFILIRQFLVNVSHFSVVFTKQTKDYFSALSTTTSLKVQKGMQGKHKGINACLHTDINSTYINIHNTMGLPFQVMCVIW